VTTFTTKHTPEQLQKMGKDDFFANVRRPFLPTETRKAIGKALSEQNPPSESQMRRLNRIVDNPSIFSGKNDAAKTALSNSGMSHIQRQYELSLIQQEPPNLGRRLLNRLNG